MDLTILFNCLKLLWMGFQLWKYKQSVERNKTLIQTVEKLNQRLIKLESEIKKLNS